MDIHYLADHMHFIPQLAQWFHTEWSYLYPQRTLADVERSIRERAQRDRLPLTLVALDGAALVGTVSLKIHDMDTRMHLTPWLAALYVAEERRRQGSGAALVGVIERQAVALGIDRLFLYTPASERFYAALGWKVRERTGYHGHAVTVMEKEISP